MMMHRILASLLSLLVLVTSAYGSHFESYVSDIVVREDATIQVTETITFVVNDSSIRHGLYRDFPVDYETADGMTKRLAFRVLEVRLDGTEAPYRLSKEGRHQRVRVGSADRTLDYGVHTMVLTYETYAQVGFFESHDELYWNATGNDWRFPIQRAIARVHLPESADKVVQRFQAYTGRYGSRGSNYSARVEGGAVVFESTGLKSREGLSIVVGWDKGVVEPPGALLRGWHAILLYPANACLALLVLTLAIALGFLYRRTQRNAPKKGAVFPRFEPPQGIGPAALRFIMRKGHDKEALTTGIVSLASNGHVLLKRVKKTWKAVSQKCTKCFWPEDSQLFGALFQHGLSIEFSGRHGERVRKALKAQETALKDALGKKYYHKQRALTIATAVLTIIGILLSSQVGANSFAMVAGNVVAIGLLIFFCVLQRRIERRILLVLLLVGLPFWPVGLLLIPTELAEVVYSLLLLSLVGLNVAACKWLPYYSTRGQKIVDHALGFKMFLAAAEKERLEMQGPDKTVEQYEAFLPYAIALGVEKRWTAQFETLLGGAGRGKGRRQGLYHHFHRRSPITGRSSFSAGLGRAISVSLTPPGTASGFSSHGSFSGGRGGFSGGGGGGGGGGGW